MTETCYLDTTVLIEALFKTQSRRRKARATIQAYRNSLLPVYAIKEMSSGALSNIIWLYNKLTETHSLAKTYEAIGANIRRPNRVATSMELLQAASESIRGVDLGDARTVAQTDQMQAEMHALSLRRIIRNGWRDRRKVTNEVVGELDCFPENPPFIDEELKIMTMRDTDCPVRRDCAYAPGLRKKPNELKLLLDVIKDSERREDVRRRKALHVLKNTPNRKFENSDCRGLGDAYFALHCPEDATILTSNQKDHVPLAETLGRCVTEYNWRENKGS
jgi:predicted nucleic acid-binding protein